MNIGGGEATAPPSRSSSSQSLRSQSTQYSQFFDDDITQIIGGLDTESLSEQATAHDDVLDNSITMVVDETFTEEVVTVLRNAKRKRPSDGTDPEERPRKLPHPTQRQSASNPSAGAVSNINTNGSPIRRAGTDSTAVTSTSNTQSSTSTTSRTVFCSPRPSDTSAGSSRSHTRTNTDCSTQSSSDTTRTSSAEHSGHAEDASPASGSHALDVPATKFVLPPPVIVAHSPFHSKWVKKLPWGVQWEIARYVNTGFTFDKFSIPELMKWQKLGRNATAVPAVSKFVEAELKKSKAADKDNDKDKDKGKGKAKANDDDVLRDEFAAAYAREQSAKLPWAELDREEDILKRHPYGALGCNHAEPFNDADPGWYGGKVHFTAKVVWSREQRDFRLVLDRPTLGSSNRFMRRFGSHRFVRVRIQKDALMQKGAGLSAYFRRPFIIAGSVFRAFFAKEQNVFLFRTNESVSGSHESLCVEHPKSASGDSGMSFIELIRWHNDLELNKDQVMTKWAARFALGLSNSIPGARMELANVKYEPDIICAAFSGEGKPPSEMQMTDGCGFANRALMQALYENFRSWPAPPTAVQIRIGGAKGLMLVRHDLPPDMEKTPTIWLRPSQTKIKYTSAPLEECILPRGTDPAKATVDVLRAARMRSPAKLSSETITNFAENGVPFVAFSKLFRSSLDERVNALLRWDEDDVHTGAGDTDARKAQMKLLWYALAREGGVMAARMSREDAGRARAAGHVAEDFEDDDWDDEDGLTQLDKALQEQSSAWWEDPISGCPSSLEETCMTMLDSGFRPETCPVLRAKLHEVAKKVIKSFSTKYKFSCPQSCSAFIVPDPYGVLGPNEIHVKSSQRNLLDCQGRMTDLIVGDVLVTRHPCKVPSDVQKVRAVEHPKLSHYVDVIVVSTASHTYDGQSLDRHLASLTGGGDYDGDTMEVFWDPELVGPFAIPDPRIYAVEPPEVDQCLVKNKQSVSKFLAGDYENAPENRKIYMLQEYLLGALQDKSLVGQYSTWWENSTYRNGYAHPDTIFLAYMFCAILDGSKTGVTVLSEKYRQHLRNSDWQHRAPAWKEIGEEATRAADESNQSNLSRPRSLPAFIMDQLHTLIVATCIKERIRIDEKFVFKTVAPEDPHLMGPWLEAEKRAKRMDKLGSAQMLFELERIKEHVEAMYTEAKTLQTEIVAQGATTKKGKKGTKTFTDLPIEQRQDVLRSLSRKFHARPEDLVCFNEHDAAQVKASYAYIHDRKVSYNKWSRFPFNVAMRALCEIKAEALGATKTVTHDFYHWMTISHAYLRKYTEDL